jgi:hypothetical protein
MTHTTTPIAIANESIVFSCDMREQATMFTATPGLQSTLLEDRVRDRFA